MEIHSSKELLPGWCKRFSKLAVSPGLLKVRGRRNTRFPRASVRSRQDSAGYLCQTERHFLLLELSEHSKGSGRKALRLQCPGEIGPGIS